MNKCIPEKLTRVPCISKIRTAYIMSQGKPIGTISEESNDAGETDWVIKVDWKAYDAQPFVIPGIDDVNRKDEYVRRDLPVFVEQRTLPDNRDRLHETLAEYGLMYNDRFEFMCRTHGICGPSRLTVERLV